MIRIALAGFAAAASLGAAAAQDSPVGKIDKGVMDLLGDDALLIVGGGLGAITQPYRGADSVRYVPEPLIIYQNEQMEFIGRTLGYTLYHREDAASDIALRVKAIGQWRFFGHDAGDDSDFLEGMAKRRGTGELGVRAEYEFGRGQVSVQGVADALSRHGGYEVEARASYELSTWLPLSVRPNGGLRYQSSSLTDYYFGVDPEEALVQTAAEARPDVLDGQPIIRPAYDVSDGVVPFVGVTARQSVHPKVAVVGGFDLNFLPGTVRDSPIVDEDVQLFAFIGMIYIFGDSPADAAAH